MQLEFNSEKFLEWCEKHGIQDINKEVLNGIHLDNIISDLIRFGKKLPYVNSTISFKKLSIIHKIHEQIRAVLLTLNELTVTRNGEIYIQNRPTSFRNLNEHLAALNLRLKASVASKQEWPHEKLNKIQEILELISTDSITVKGSLAIELENQINTFQMLLTEEAA